MNIAIIIAGGIGSRLQRDIPKQFLEIEGKPIIIYTLSTFQESPEIDKILVVCVKGWENRLKEYADHFGISKLEWIIEGGENGQGSARNGIFFLEDKCDPQDIILIHDAVRPLITPDIISDCVAICKEKGNASSSIPLQETIVRTKDGISGNQTIDRSEIMRVQTPQAYKYIDILKGHKDALKAGITNAIYANTMMVDLGHTIYFSKGSPVNIKITTEDDLLIFGKFLK